MAVRYLPLAFYKAYADLRAEAARTYISFLWWMLDPILHMLVFYVVFAVLLQRRTEDYTVFLLVGLVSWKWFQGAIMHASGAIGSAQGLMRQVYLPKTVFPLSIVITDTAKFGFAFAMLLVFLWLYGLPPSITYWALPVLLVIELLLVSACALLVGAIVPFLPDLRFVIDNFLTLMFFVSGVFFGIDQVPEHLRTFLYLNPMAVIIDNMRRVLMHGEWPQWSSVTAVGFMSLAIGALALYVLRRYDRIYPRLMLH